MTNKNIEVLKDFERYCLAHPTERFWQCLRNWSGFSFVIGRDFKHNEEKQEIDEIDTDTFYFEKKDK